MNKLCSLFCATISNPYLLNFIQQFGEVVSRTTDEEDFDSIITSMSSNALESAGLGSMLGTSIKDELDKEPVSLKQFLNKIHLSHLYNLKKFKMICPLKNC